MTTPPEEFDLGPSIHLEALVARMLMEVSNRDLLDPPPHITSVEIFVKGNQIQRKGLEHRGSETRSKMRWWF